MFSAGCRVKVVWKTGTFNGTLLEPFPDAHWLIQLDLGVRVVAHWTDLVIPYYVPKGAGT